MDHMLHVTAHANIPFSRPSTPTIRAPIIGFCGLGAMGYPMARNLATHQHSRPQGAEPLRVFNRTHSRAERLAEEVGTGKVRIVENAAQLARECDIILTSLSSDAAVKSIYQEFAEALKDVNHDRPKIFVETSTCYPTLAGELDGLISSFPHTHLVTCPVLGPPAQAEKAGLILIMSGDYKAKKELAYILVPAVGRKVVDLGGNLEKAPTMKLICNSVILGFNEVMAEAFTMGEKSGIGAEAVLNFIHDFYPVPSLNNYSNKMAHDLFDGTKGFALDGGLKDVNHIRKMTAEYNASMPVMDIAHNHLLTARAIHDNQKASGSAKFDVLDWSALIAGSRVAAGLDGLNSGKHLKVERED